LPASPAGSREVSVVVGQDARKEESMAAPDRRATGGITAGGVIVIIGIVLALFVSLWLGIIVILIGLIAFGGFARGKWY